MNLRFQTFLNSDKIYAPNEISEMIDAAFNGGDIVEKKKTEYWNYACSFDIETTSFVQNDQKCATMYEWTLGLNGTVMVGRTWDEFSTVVKNIVEKLGLNSQRRLIIYVHNLSYEFQFICKRFEWDSGLAIEPRKPIFELTSTGIEFRCSYLLSGYSLAKLGDELQQYKIQKKVGDLDYEVIRHSATPLTEKEIGYCVNDVKVVMAYVEELIEQYDSITKLPLTNTGFVRNYVRNECFTDGTKKSFKRLNYMSLMKTMTLTNEEYKQLKRAFQGGFTHASPFYSGKILKDVSSDDFTSSYPAVMVSEMFPMSSSELVQISTKEEFEKNLKCYCCLFDVEFDELESQIFIDSYISSSRCFKLEEPVINNGRVVQAKLLATTITEQDYLIIKKFYKWKKCRISNFRKYKKNYLPTSFVKAILKLYNDKTQLKGVEGKEIEYLRSKGMLNSCYGMAVTDIIRPDNHYDNENGWTTDYPVAGDAIKEYNENRNRFMFYPWGVWVTAYARRNLFTGIINFGNDYVYSDTDSIKSLNHDKHIDYINKYNDIIRKKLLQAMDYHNLPHDLIEPLTIKGKKKTLGVWDYEGTYDKFKTLGAKRYMVEKDGELSITVSGLNKKIAVPYLLDTYKNKVFDAFSNELYVPADYTGKNTHTYIDEPLDGLLTDYLGNTAEFHELSCIHLSKSDYSLSISQEYLDYIFDMQDE